MIEKDIVKRMELLLNNFNSYDTVVDWDYMFSFCNSEEEITAMYYVAAIRYPDSLPVILKSLHSRGIK